jgi:hypothetical protein
MPSQLTVCMGVDDFSMDAGCLVSLAAICRLGERKSREDMNLFLDETKDFMVIFPVVHFLRIFALGFRHVNTWGILMGLELPELLTNGCF